MYIIKIGGGETINLPGVISGLTELKDKFAIVHGADATRDQLAKDLKLSKIVLDSHSGDSSVFSDETAIDLLMMACAGLKNKRIVELCQQNGINAVGLSGLDGKLIQGKRNQGVRIREKGKLKIVRDFSGKPRQINKALLELLLQNQYVPVLCVPIVDENNFAIDAENDDIINLLVETLNAKRIIQLIEAPGFLENKNDPNTLVAKISRHELQMRENQVDDQMKSMILAWRMLFEVGARSVIISDGRTEHPIKDALEGKGTRIE